MSTLGMLRQDCHAHSTISDGADTPAANVEAAARAGLDLLVMVEHVRGDSTQIPMLVGVAGELNEPDGLRVRAGIEAKILDDRGELDAPEDLRGVDLMAIADYQLPSPAGPLDPGRAQELIAGGEIGASEAVGWLLDGVVAAAHRSAPERFTVVVHPLSLLPKLDLSESFVSDRALHQTGLELAAIGVGVEVSERWRCPSPDTARRLHAAGVELVPGTDAHSALDIGRYSYVRDVLAQVPDWQPGAIVGGLTAR